MIIVTGLSGAGRSTALNVLEDLGYEVFDNIPPALIADIKKHCDDKPLAIGIDTRTRGFSVEALLAVRDQYTARLLFLDAESTVLQRRYTETRRAHPMAKDRPVKDGIKAEKILLTPLKSEADEIIDTSVLSIHDLKHILTGQFSLDNDAGLTVTVMSFSYKKGLPREADFVFDVRFLHNPHWQEHLRPLTGQDKDVQAYIQTDPNFETLTRQIKPLLKTVIQGNIAEGKRYLTIAFGCSGGKHRSVFLTETLSDWLENCFEIQVLKQHRELAA